MKVILISPGVDEKAVGETYVAFKWAEALSTKVDLTVLAFQSPGPDRRPLSEQLPHANVVTWRPPQWPKSLQRLNAMLKPNYPIFARHVRRWLQEQQDKGQRFDLAHQIMPQAPRYACPFRGFETPYVVGPLGGTLTTPDAFLKEEAESSYWFTTLRKLDRVRFRYDPWLRRSYSDASMILGVAPYMQDVLSSIPIQRFEPVLELGVESLPPEVPKRIGKGLKLLHVGRGVRTKGLRDVVRAMAQLKEFPDITLTSAGSGPELDICKSEAQKLGVADRITFEGQVHRSRVEELYQSHDVFVFPSFREPAGNVLYEAMRNSLPIIAAARGGPDYIVDEDVGIKLPVTTPEALATDIAQAVKELYSNPKMRERLGQGARAKLQREGLWETKAAALVTLYEELLKDLRTHPSKGKT